MWNKLALACLLVCVAAANGNPVVFPAACTQPDPDIKNLRWNRYVADNFTILSIDDGQGRWLYDNVESVKSWCLTRWGLPDVKFGRECRIFCVPNQALLGKLFNIDRSTAETRRPDGLHAVWLTLDDRPARTVPVQLSNVVFAEFEDRYGLKPGSTRGMAQLNATPAEIRGVMARPAGDAFATDEDAARACLMLRKEFGQDKFHAYLKAGGPDAAVQVYGYKNSDEWNSAYKRFAADLARGIAAGKTPDSYLMIRAK